MDTDARFADVRRLLTAAEALIDEQPDDARELLIEAARGADQLGMPDQAARACEVMGRIALATGDTDVAAEVLAQAAERYRALGEPALEARAAAALEFARAPEGFVDDDEAMAAELALVQALLAHRAAGGTLEAHPTLVARRTWLELASAAATRDDEPASMHLVKRRIGLDRVSLALLGAAAAPAIDERLAKQMREAQGDLVARAPSAWFLAELVQPSLIEPVTMDHFAESAPLRSHDLVTLYPHPDRPRGARRHLLVDIDPDVASFLEGARELSAPLQGVGVLASGPAELLPFAPEVEARREQLVRALTTGEGVRRVILIGPAGSGKKTLATHVAAELGRRLLVLQLATGGETARLAPVLRAAGRDARLHDALLAVDVGDGLGEDGARALTALTRSLTGAPAPLFVVTRSAGAVDPLVTPEAVDVRLGGLGFELQLVHFEAALARLGSASPGRELLAPVVCQAGMTPGAIRAAAERAVARARLEAPGQAPGADHLRDAVRVEHASTLSRVAQRIQTTLGWADFVAAPAVEERMRDIVAYVRHQAHVFDVWGFRAKVPYGRGVTALFSGPPGTGKTMAASLIAAELGLDLYRIDLAQMVSKYIGETEKNLGAVFDRAESGEAVLLFDEADSLFGKRTEVKTSVDRYSNLEVNYLLQRLESFQGIAILTTNFLKNIDEAFRRRLRFIVDFPMPSQAEREQLWRSLLPARAEVRGEMPWATLADLQLAGGSIKNAVMRAAFQAARRGDAILPYDFLSAASLELEAMGRLPPDLSHALRGVELPPGSEPSGDGTPLAAEVASEPVEDEAGDAADETDPEAIARGPGLRPLLTRFPFPRREAAAH